MDKWIFLLLLFTACIAADWRQWRTRDRKTLIWGIAFALPAVYLTVLFAVKPDWPGFGELLQWIYGAPSDRLIRLLNSGGA